ncbi:helix-turn-helix transcriptional regulator [Staphylococcus sp. IVB6233]|uniref:helix-turn-helix domain-containing protein n=1 Tax=Staphylococcus sp. IVB6233 TaxID=2989769 RepID=UPI0021D31201|nr:helix-turn-helix transcriptional regulator [Staphylococcus sp. IVB6233]UXR75716.1 helix-turn-helix transcriptional regulator [Staphylococcus sp. IVB6233]
MIRNRLSDLLGERQIKISNLSLMTGIARSTLTPIYFNQSEMIKIDTINKICMALEVNVDDFFESVNFDIDFFRDNDSIDDIIFFIDSNESGIYNFNIDIASICQIHEKHNKYIFDVNFKSTTDTKLDDSVIYIGEDNKGKDIWSEGISELFYEMEFNDSNDKGTYLEYKNKLSIGLQLVLENKIVEFIRNVLLKEFKDYDDNQYFNQPKQNIEKLLKKVKINLVD